MGTLFIVDDDRNTLFPLKYWFEKKGHRVHTFESSKMLYYTLETVMPDFILLDVNLAGEYGFDVCKHLKDYLQVNTTIYLWSANSTVFERLAEYKADGFIQKPVDFDALNHIVETYMRN